MKNLSCLTVVLMTAGCWVAEVDVEVSPLVASAHECSDSPAFDLFPAGLCICDGLTDVGSIEVRSPVGALGLGVNGSARLVTQTRIDGAMRIGGDLHTVATLDVGDDTHVDGDATWVGNLHVGANLAVGGDLKGTGSLDVEQELSVGGAWSVVGSHAIGGQGPYATPASPPCACDETVLDIAAEVAAAAVADDVLELGDIRAIGSSELLLASGRYHASGLEHVGSLRIQVDGPVALYVSGSIDLVGADLIELNPGATLDLFVSGDIGMVGSWSFGSEVDPAAFRIYVGGEENIRVGSVGNARVNGAIYAPRADLEFVGSLEVHGAVLARTLHGVGNLTVTYERPDGDCRDPGPVDPEPSPDPEPEPDPEPDPQNDPEPPM